MCPIQNRTQSILFVVLIFHRSEKAKVLRLITFHHNILFIFNVSLKGKGPDGNPLTLPSLFPFTQNTP